MRDSEVSRYFARKALRFVREHPRTAAELVWRKALLFWGPLSVSNEKEDEYERAYSPVLRRLPLRFPAVLALALVGVASALRDLRKRQGRGKEAAVSWDGRQDMVVLVLLFVASYFVSYLPFFVAGRYRVPLLPFVLLFAAIALDQFVCLVRARSGAKAAVWVAVAASAYLLVGRNWTGYVPDLAKWHHDRGVAWDKRGQLDRAVAEYREALRLRPDSVDSHFNLGVIMARQDHFDRAVYHYQEVLRIEPRDVQAHYNLARALASHGARAEAVFHYREALKIRPEWPQALGNLAWLLACAPGGQDQDRQEAVRLAESACRLDGGRGATFLDGLAAAYASVGRFEDAQAAARKALAAAGAAGDAELADEIRKRLQLYEQRKPFVLSE